MTIAFTPAPVTAPRRATLASILPRDPRWFQIFSLGVLLSWGMLFLGFNQKPWGIACVFAAALLTQATMTRLLTPASRFDPLSAAITSLSLSLLLRVDDAFWMAIAATLAIGSKFLIRVNGKHLFNPATFAIVALLAAGQGWVSPSQWGSRTLAAFFFASLAGLVLTRARRADIALAFLGSYVALVFLRAFWLGDPLAIPLKQIQSGALLLFAFFMISDPKTTPDARMHRVLFGVFVASLGFALQFIFYVPEGLIYALFASAPLVPLLDRLRPLAPARRFHWSRPQT